MYRDAFFPEFAFHILKTEIYYTYLQEPDFLQIIHADQGKNF